MPSFSRFLRAIEWICLENFVLSLKIKKSHDGCLYLDLLVGVGLPSAPPRNLWKEQEAYVEGLGADLDPGPVDIPVFPDYGEARGGFVWPWP